MQYRQVCGSAPTRSQLRGVIGLTVSHIRHDFFSHPATVKYVSITWKAPNMSKKRVLGKLSKISFGTFAFHPNVWHHLPRDSQKSRPVMCDKLEKKKKTTKVHTMYIQNHIISVHLTAWLIMNSQHIDRWILIVCQ